MEREQGRGMSPEQMREKIAGVVQNLQTEAEDRVSKRNEIERRWLTDLRQFHGKYEGSIANELEDAKRSSVFINETRSKTNACAARLSDMLFPTDDKNWGIKPTPVPTLATDAQRAAEAAAKGAEQATRALAEQGADAAQQIAAEADAAAQAAAKLRADQDEARKRATAMEGEIEDQLRECQYAIEARDVIDDACKVGIGVMKGPVTSDRVRWRWELDPESKSWKLDEVDDVRPAYRRVDYWSFFPEIDVRNIDDSEGVFERRLMSKKQLRALSRRSGFDRKAIRRLLREDPRQTMPTYIAELRSIDETATNSANGRYHVWEYHGPVDGDDMMDICACLGVEDMAADIEPDPLMTVEVVIWFCDGELLKFGIHVLDSGESIYSVFNIEKDDASIFGYGIPYIMRDSQKAMNGAWRMMLDNSGLSAGPQIEVDKSVIEPENGRWELEPRKIWSRKEGQSADRVGIRVHHIDSHQSELANIIELAKQFIDDETAISMLSQGEQGTHTTQTLGGMSILMNATNIVFRRMVKNFDDDMTVPNIRRLYHWNMQFSKREDIKGDYDVDARGTSVLLVREMQSQNLMAMALNFAGHPVLGPITKVAALYRRLVQSFMLEADEIVRTDDEIKEMAAAQAQEGPSEAEIEIEKLQRQMEIAMLEAQSRLDVARLNQHTEMVKLAEQRNMKLDDLNAMLESTRMQAESKERIFAGEAAIEERRDRRNAERPEAASGGSGGYIS